MARSLRLMLTYGSRNLLHFTCPVQDVTFPYITTYQIAFVWINTWDTGHRESGWISQTHTEASLAQASSSLFVSFVPRYWSRTR